MLDRKKPDEESEYSGSSESLDSQVTVVTASVVTVVEVATNNFKATPSVPVPVEVTVVEVAPNNLKAAPPAPVEGGATQNGFQPESLGPPAKKVVDRTKFTEPVWPRRMDGKPYPEHLKEEHYQWMDAQNPSPEGTTSTSREEKTVRSASIPSSAEIRPTPKSCCSIL
eukprot:GHVP01040994.1.p1 GENE.GHVP01040994.1~~GHVP01040994.1.p1  ORF type:complete len:168 (-),score=29.99 GHVP01040994.1:271-774(-)